MRVNASGGFALPLVLVAVAVASFSILSLAQSGQGRERRARAEAERFDARVSAESTEARMAHLLVTEPLGARTLNVAMGPTRAGVRRARGADEVLSVMLDGRPYAVMVNETASRPVVLRIQDDAGLLNLNALDERQITRHLSAANVPFADARALAAVLADFIDEDSLRRAGGMDGADYPRPGAARNRALEDVRQALAAPGWSQALTGTLAEAVLLESSALASGAWFNPNTATPQSMRSVFGIDASSAQRVLAARERQLLLTRDDVIALTGAADVNVGIQARPASSMLFTMTVPRGSSQGSFLYVSRFSFKQGDAVRPFEMTRLIMPVRAYSRERGRIDENDRLVSLPKSARMFGS